MHPITALMLSRSIEDDRRRELARRPSRLLTAEPMRSPRGAQTWSMRILRLATGASRG